MREYWNYNASAHLKRPPLGYGGRRGFPLRGRRGLLCMPPNLFAHIKQQPIVDIIDTQH